LCLLRVDAPPGDDELHRLGKPDDQRQAHRQSVTADDVPAALERAELGILGGDANVGEERRLEARGKRVSIDGRDDGLEDVGLARVAALAWAVVQPDAVGVVVPELAEVRGRRWSPRRR
jgi:hypothetical protein